MTKEVRKVTRSPQFIKQTKRLDSFNAQKLRKQILKILENPEVGKPLRYTKRERALYIKPFRLIYALRKGELILLKFEHRKNVYKK